MATKNPKKLPINNKRFHILMVEFKNDYYKTGNKIIQNRELAELIYKVSYNLSFHYKFINYHHIKDDLIMEGCEHSLKYGKNYKEDKFANPLAFFSTIIWNAYIRYIMKEYKQTNIKEFQNCRITLSDSYELQPHDIGTKFENGNLDFEESKVIFRHSE